MEAAQWYLYFCSAKLCSSPFFHLGTSTQGRIQVGGDYEMMLRSHRMLSLSNIYDNERKNHLHTIPGRYRIRFTVADSRTVPDSFVVVLTTGATVSESRLLHSEMGRGQRRREHHENTSNPLYGLCKGELIPSRTSIIAVRSHSIKTLDLAFLASIQHNFHAIDPLK